MSWCRGSTEKSTPTTTAGAVVTSSRRARAYMVKAARGKHTKKYSALTVAGSFERRPSTFTAA